MLNYETLLSSYDDKLTLMQWLKKVEAALKNASAVSFNVTEKGNATLTFSIVFEDGSEIESGEIVLQQGESVASAAIVNGHLILTLTNGDTIDAGNMFDGNVNITGTLSVVGDVSTGGAFLSNDFLKPATLANQVDVSTDKGTMAFDFSAFTAGGYTAKGVYGSARISNAKLNIVLAFEFSNESGAGISQYVIQQNSLVGRVNLSSDILSKLFPLEDTSFIALDAREEFPINSGGYTSGTPIRSVLRIDKASDGIIFIYRIFNATTIGSSFTIADGERYYIRHEINIGL